MQYILLDDDMDFGDDFTKMCSHYDENAEFEVFSDEEKFFDHLSKHGSDIAAVFMDIRLKSSSGIDAAKKVNDLFAGIPVVFITGYPQEYCQSIFLEHFDFEPFAFVCKPVDSRVLAKVFEKLGTRAMHKDTEIAVRSGHCDRIVKCSEIVYLESDKWYYLIHTRNEDIQVRGKLSDLHGSLTPKFIIPHKSYIINSDMVRKFDNVSVTLNNGVTLPISRSHKKNFKQELLHLRGLSKV
ncbi:MAG: response regulator transcription factor [Ruminococcus sp.]|nr:response regulator transcription factor [Ruminococcus sp.]